MEITTEPFRIPTSVYARETVTAGLLRLWWIPTIIIITAGIGTIFDPRWAFVGLIVIFLIIPFAIFNIYFSRLLTPEARRVLAEKQIIFCPKESVTLHFTDPTAPLPEITIDWDKIESLNCGKDYLRIDLQSSPIPFLLFPRESLSAEQLDILRSEILNE